MVVNLSICICSGWNGLERHQNLASKDCSWEVPAGILADLVGATCCCTGDLVAFQDMWQSVQYVQIYTGLYSILYIIIHPPFPFPHIHIFCTGEESILGAYDGVSAQVNPSAASRAGAGRNAAAPTFRHE